MTKKKVFAKYGPYLRIYEKGQLVTELFYPKSLKTELRFLDRSFEGYITNLSPKKPVVKKYRKFKEQRF